MNTQNVKSLNPGQKVVGYGTVAGVENNASQTDPHNGTTLSGLVRVRFTSGEVAAFVPTAQVATLS